MNTAYGPEAARATALFLRQRGYTDPQVGIVLGTGLSGLAGLIENRVEQSYEVIPGFPVSTVESHAGKLLFGTIQGKRVVALQGRFHFYEGYDLEKATFPIRVLKELGIKQLILSNAAGALNPAFKKGTLMLLSDHINLLPGNPLIGTNVDEWGPRFPDMSEPYDRKSADLTIECAADAGIVLNRGVYVSVAGPNLETRAEYRFLRLIGADAVGMSTVPEVIVARHMGLPVVAISVLTDECDPEKLEPVSLDDILKVAGEAEKDLTRLMLSLIAKL
ncbi:MAG TPA: purine-nucleoside phosphorylase [Bacteroidia bacterium]|nr:purine-nucleoside phosphorylase [Bacteroidia bacterium]